jgi:hypothetical protein
MMRLVVAHELGFALAITCSLLSVLLGGALPEVMWFALLAVPISAWQSLYRRPLPVAWGSALALLFFAIAVQTLVVGGMSNALIAACILLVGIVVARLLTRVWPSHDLQALLLSLLLLFAGTVVHQELTYALVLVVYTVAITWALLTRQLITGCVLAFFRNGSQAELDASLARRDVVTPRFFATVACLAWVILCSTGLLFVAFPRVGMRQWNLGETLGHLPPGISLTGPARAQPNANVVARLGGLDEKAVEEGLYLRGRIYDALDQTGFHRSDTLGRVRPSLMHLATQGKPQVYQLYSLPIDGDTLLALGPVISATQMASNAGSIRPNGPEVVTLSTGEIMSLEPVEAPMRWEITGYKVPLRVGVDRPQQDALLPPDTAYTEAFLSLPNTLDPRIATLAKKTVGDAVSFAQKAARLRSFLLNQFSYTLAQPNAGRQDPLASFLFTDRRGHCEYFATAYAVLLRQVGIPSRVVGGYQGGIWDPRDERVLFTGAHAHAWVEWYLPHVGWVMDDATPPSDPAPLTATQMWLEHLRGQWDESVLRFGLTQQMALWHSLTHAIGATLPQTLGIEPWGSSHQGNFRYKAWAVFWGAPLGGLGVWLLRRYQARRQGPALERALYRAACRLLKKPLPPQMTYGELVEAVQLQDPTMSASTLNTLREAIAVYAAVRFGSLARAPHTRALCRRLRSL